MKISIQQSSQLVNDAIIDRFSHWVIISSQKSKNSLTGVPYADLVKTRRKQLARKNDNDEPVELDIPNKRHSHLSHSLVSPEISSFKLLGLARKLIKSHLEFNPDTLALSVVEFDPEVTEKIYEALIAAIATANAVMPEFKQKKTTDKAVNKIKIFGHQQRHGYKRTLAEAEGNALARSLSMLPSNVLTPTDYLKRIRILARENKWKLDFYDEKKLRKKKGRCVSCGGAGQSKC